jgi:nicotinate-nucleotide--dimethylbenzimidazole phosphoribosyltransferase
MTAALSPLRSLEFIPVPGVDEDMRGAAKLKLDCLTKPVGSLGALESLAAQLCAIQSTLTPTIRSPVTLVFAADHGVAARGVSAYPREVTLQMVANFLGGGAAISVLARLQGMPLWIVDAGVDGDCRVHAQLIDAKIRRGTRDFLEMAAMTVTECQRSLRGGREALEQVRGDGNTVVFGEMGIGNTASAALLMHGITGHALDECIGRGTGLDDAGLARKRALLATAIARRAPPSDAVELLTEFGGYEIAMLVGAILAAAGRRMVVMIDGFTVTVAAAVAARIEPAVIDYCVFGHASAEFGHAALLRHLGVRPILDLGMRLGEGSGAAIALTTVRAGLALFTEMATFEGAGVSERR